jgi:hypothetical protein
MICKEGKQKFNELFEETGEVLRNISHDSQGKTKFVNRYMSALLLLRTCLVTVWYSNQSENDLQRY